MKKGLTATQDPPKKNRQPEENSGTDANQQKLILLGILGGVVALVLMVAGAGAIVLGPKAWESATQESRLKEQRERSRKADKAFADEMQEALNEAYRPQKQ